MRKPKHFYVYLMSNRPRSHVLYTGVTGGLVRRVFQHKNKLVEGFTSRYNLTRLVYYEQFMYPDAAIAREKEIKGWRRSKKIRLIESTNPHWRDLSEGWWDRYKPTNDAVQRRAEYESIGPDNKFAGVIPDARVLSSERRDLACGTSTFRRHPAKVRMCFARDPSVG